MIAMYDFYPKYCPNCGKQLKVEENLRTAGMIKDLMTGNPHACECGVAYLYVETDYLEEEKE